jgi:6-phosphogluconolactonase
MEVLVRADARSVAHEAASRIAVSVHRALAARGRFSFVLAGGSTPALLYELLASSEYLDLIDWARVAVFFGDERCVPPDHEWSNYAMARRTLLDRLPMPAENIHRMAGELPPGEAAAAYTATIAATFTPEERTTPRFDLILLGMGDDGHTASLFPGMPVLLERDAWVAGTPVPEYVRPQVARVTLTLPVLNAAHEVFFLISGQAKAEPVRTVLRDAQHDSVSAALPAAQVRPRDGGLIWLLDEPAASLLKE